ncbi:hypothetical protein EV191_110115 [Tamaricihabitans halophyticus]|uniref:DUF1542 domain-containing protein n=1 Tax=Tamaricihabitans halophyticus TaxID=1262583 RepID=A0A4R2QHD1_9PSEU|nr:hypothetical protein [Tamaricihabitans halophyticus]TCP48557.1 hypothetical protein EV191_110115 [Tamaricihabitans halophyticus]
METPLILLALVIVIIGLGVVTVRKNAAARQQRLEDAKAESRRWVERLGGQVMNLTGTDTASQQAIADAAERYTAAGSQMEQATSVEQCRLVTETAAEGLYYVRAARVAMGMDPGPEPPMLNGQRDAGKVSEHRKVTVEGEDYEASPEPGANTPHYYPGGRVAGRPVPQGWYSQPWWKPALVAGAWGVGSMMLFSTMFAGMAGVPYAAGDMGGDMDGGGDMGGEGDMGDGGDMGGDMGGDFGGGDFGDMGGFGDFGF